MLVVMASDQVTNVFKMYIFVGVIPLKKSTKTKTNKRLVHKSM